MSVRNTRVAGASQSIRRTRRFLLIQDMDSSSALLYNERIARDENILKKRMLSSARITPVTMQSAIIP
jgi:hypothetical protein